jgi:hypothetical protein
MIQVCDIRGAQECPFDHRQIQNLQLSPCNMEMGLGNVLVSRLLESVIKVSPEAHDSSILVICANLNDWKLE